MEKANSFLGVGWSFPPTFDRANYSVRMAEGSHSITESIDMILRTDVGSNPVNPEFGSNLRSFLFRTFDTTLQGEIEREVLRVLLDYEPRIKVDEVVISMVDEFDGRLDLTIVYTVVQNNTRHNHVYPFFLTEGTNL